MIFREKKRFQKLELSLLFALIVFFIMLLTILLVFGGMYFLFRLQIVTGLQLKSLPLLLFALVSLITGTVLAAMVSKCPLSPLRKIMKATDRVAAGDYSTRIYFKGPLEFKQLSESFNHMAEEIGSVEMLRHDFVNNFSHEFRTPIVSIRGFARMLKRDDLTTDERNEYLDTIIDESERLAELASNVLNLSKIERQSILADKKHYNVSEQLRLVIALLDGKWSDKHIDITFDCGEIFLYGSEDLLKQAWINLLDNAIKFSPDYGTISLAIHLQGQTVVFSFADQGEGMSEETAAHIFDKFYQGDTSHGTKGNGLGLTITKRIIELHGGSIAIASTGKEGTVFEIRLPPDRNMEM